MGHITLRPELITSGGEASGIMLEDQYVGSLTLLYREEDRMWGTVQLDEEMLAVDEKEEIDLFIHRHIQHMIDALGVPECLVTITYSEYDHVVSTENVEHIEELMDEGNADNILESEYIDDGNEVGLLDEEIYLEDEADLMTRDWRLTIVGEARHRVEYNVHDEEESLVGEVMMRIVRGDVGGEIIWQFEPTEEEIDGMARLLVSDFDPEQVDTFTFVMLFDGEEMATVELTHEELLDINGVEEDIVNEMSEDKRVYDDMDTTGEYIDIFDDEDTYLYFELIRNELDVLIYDLYEERGPQHVRLGTVTIDMASLEVTALVDFINPRDEALREQVAYHLIDIMEDDIEFVTLTVTMQYNDDVIDEYSFDTDEQPDAAYQSAAHGESDLQETLYSH